jgi:predicted transcriptional regulator
MLLLVDEREMTIITALKDTPRTTVELRGMTGSQDAQLFPILRELKQNGLIEENQFGYYNLHESLCEPLH